MSAGERVCVVCERGFVSTHSRQKYCGPHCQQQGVRQSNRQACRRHAERVRVDRALMLLAAETEHETRQARPRPVWQLEWHAHVVIQPDRPAALRRYTNGAPTLFQDDRNAVLDHGSPGRPLVAGGHAQSMVSPLAWTIAV